MYKIKKTEKLEGSIVELQVEIEASQLEKFWTHAIMHVGENVNIAGFRKGHIPEKVLVSQVGEMAILEDCAEHAIEEVYIKILEKENLRPIASPKIAITKIGKGASLEVTIRIPVLPEISLPDYKNISKKENSKKEKVEVTEKEVETVVLEIQKHREKSLGKDVVVDDAFAQSVGNFKDLKEFKEKIKENILKEKEIKAIEKKRTDIIEAIIKGSQIDPPEILIEDELQKMINNFSNYLSEHGTTLENFLKNEKKTEDDLRKEWLPQATINIKGELVLFEIGKLEKVKIPDEKITADFEILKKEYPTVDETRLKGFVEDRLVKEEVWKILTN